MLEGGETQDKAKLATLIAQTSEAALHCARYESTALISLSAYSNKPAATTYTTNKQKYTGWPQSLVGGDTCVRFG